VGAGSAGFIVSSAGAGVAAGGVAGSVTGGLVLCVVVVSVPLSLHAAMPNNAIAETEARMNFFITLSFSKSPGTAGGRMKMFEHRFGFVTNA
jgi:hypothetical protein